MFSVISGHWSKSIGGGGPELRGWGGGGGLSYFFSSNINGISGYDDWFN